MRKLLFIPLLFVIWAPAAQAADSGLAGTFCGNGAGQPDITSAPKVKVLYGYASDQPNRLQQVGGELQEALRQGAQQVLDSTAGQKSLRVDRNPACGMQYADIQAVKMPRALSAYLAYTSTAERFSALREDLTAAGLYPDRPNNTLLFMDRGGNDQGGGGRATTPTDSRPGPDNASNLGGNLAVVFGYPAESTSGFFDPTSWPHSGHLSLHELFHTFGAVQSGAPNHANQGHCKDGNDLMCSGNPGAPCGWENGWDLRLDCGGDDYFSASPAPGSWLESHWNIFNSWFLCEQSSCSLPESSPQAALTASGEGSARTLTVSAPGATRFFWDLDGQGGFERDSSGQTSVQVALPAYGRSYQVRATMPGGAYSVAKLDLPGTGGGSGGGSSELLVDCTPTTVYVGEKVTCQVSGSQAQQASSLTWDWGDKTTSSGAAVTHTYSSPGSKTVSLKITTGTYNSFSYTQIRVLAGQMKLKAAKINRKALRRGALKLTVTGAPSSEKLTARFIYRKASRLVSARTKADGSAALSLRPNMKMKRALARSGTLKVTVTSQSGQAAALAIKLR